MTPRDFHPVAEFFPLMEGAEFDALKNDIAANGLREAIWLHPDGRIIDGRNRYRACMQLSIEPKYRTWNGEGSLTTFVVSLNLHRRHLTSSQRAVLAFDIQEALAAEIEEQRQELARRSAEMRWTQERIGEEMYAALRPHLPSKTQARQEKIEQRRAEQLVYFIQDGNTIKIGVSVDPESRLKELRTGNPAVELIGSVPGGIELERQLHAEFAENNVGGEWYRLTDQFQAKMDSLMRVVNIDEAHKEKRNSRQETAKTLGVSEGYISDAKVLRAAAPDLLAEVKAGNKTIPQAKRELTQRQKADPPPLPESSKFRVFYADPPWPYNDSGVIGPNDNYGHVARHYPSMKIDELCAMGSQIKEIAEDNAVLFLWTTSPLLEECFDVIRAWGFKYKTSFVWDKVRHNYGHYNSVRHEFLFVCTRGSCTPDNKKLYDSVQSIEKSRKHSEKPEEFRAIIDSLYTWGKRIELFSRSKVDGWDSWGNEIQ